METKVKVSGITAREILDALGDEVKPADILSVGDVVQLNPETVRNKAFAASLMIVTELKTWGVQGYVQVLGENRDGPGGQAYYRAKWAEIEYVGRAVWAVSEQEENTDNEVQR